MARNEWGVILLAGGKGIINGQPKTLLKVDGLSMPQRLVASLEQLDLPIVVVASGISEIRKGLERDLGHFKRVRFVVQPWRLGTADAFSRGASLLQSLGCSDALVVHADHPAWTVRTFQEIIGAHQAREATMTLGVVRSQMMHQPWPRCFQNFGRIYRDNGTITVIETRRTEEIRSGDFEFNAALYCLKLEWGMQNLGKLLPRYKESPQDDVPEFFLPELLKIAFEAGEKLHFEPVFWMEAMAVNTKEELEECMNRYLWK
ncbi:MAG: hypothetical protein A2722_00485 [Candidatus Doudnabacteria bacterium RIFCSPHIGHO2_01_FULL_50_11]|uniref:MobA-like NTP transferase domain-containing protein n=1 Tax=Candidatus Doudnabacteria bacterium RIFCSPHIGHO2_01_FULL_50_11 TaxID=1817828 RepID=A0A1F5PH02_9BACT|nr:MAG: hypothetical protein A2722_00485 [Candidatus Doudnabacteria bacterium RIFCSPHIGHO2_01_FULL_50_11]HLC44357.1 NTP transferase domain-containing protein [Patescibacteria group bacterium]